MRLAGGAMKARSTMLGRPFSSSRETSASPTPSSVMTPAASKAGLARRVLAAIRTAF